VTLEELNALDAASAARELLRCSGSTAWAARMSAARPFASAEAMGASADHIWSELTGADWREAFAAHPRIGGSGEGGWSASEQSRVATASAATLERLAAKNRDYHARFGYIFIVCATGKSADEMLAMLEQRLTNDPETEIGIAAVQQRQITRLRLDKLLKETR
jgi:2-oxo-4-hydroxy-4-carboxy-5-ureidoimidazoline decarboxylase